MKTVKALWVLLLFAMLAIPAWSQTADLRILPQDTRIEASKDGGYYLYVKKTPGVQAILLTESTEDPERKVATYALRNPAYHPENGDEQRLLEGEFIDPKGSLMDSTAIEDSQFGSAFRIFIPYVVVYGYEWTRNGALQIVDGTYISIRAFEKPYADYTGAFFDNPFLIRMVQQEQRPAEAPVDESFSSEMVSAFSQLSAATTGHRLFSPGEDDILTQLSAILDPFPQGALDLVLVLDTTQSMGRHMDSLKKHLVNSLRQKAGERSDLRIGVTLYRDYLEAYLYRILPMATNWDEVQRSIDSARTLGGRDIPEAVHEALYAALTRYDWQAENRIIVLVGDAPPHPIARGDISAEMVVEKAQEHKVEISVIMLPN